MRRQMYFALAVTFLAEAYGVTLTWSTLFTIVMVTTISWAKIPLIVRVWPVLLIFTSNFTSGASDFDLLICFAASSMACFICGKVMTE